MDLDEKLLRRLGEELTTEAVESYAPAAQRLPPYVEHAEGIGRVGALTAEAVVSEFEALGSSIVGMTRELQTVIDKCEATKAQCLATIAKAQTWADDMRDMGKEAFEDIQKQSLLLDRIGKEIDTLRQAATAA